MDAVLQLEQWRANVAAVMLETDTVLVVIAFSDPEGSFDRLQDLGDRDRSRVSRQQISPFRAILAFDESLFGQRLQNLRKKLDGDVLLLGNLLGIDQPGFRHIAELHRGHVLESHQGIVCFFRKLQHDNSDSKYRRLFRSPIKVVGYNLTSGSQWCQCMINLNNP